MLRLLQVTDTLVERGEELLEQGRDTVENLVETARAEPALLAILIGIGVLTAFIFVWGLVKHVVKAAVIGGLLSAGAWYWYFNIR